MKEKIISTQHSAITDPNIHEPKGASTAAAGTTYVASGAGSGVWSLPKPNGSDTAVLGTIPVSDGAGSIAWKHNPGSVHGEIYLTGASVSVGPTGGTITTDADYRVVGPTWTLNTGVSNAQLHTSNQALQILVTGHYLLSSYITFATGAVAAGTNYALKYRVNGSATLSARKLATQKVTTGVDTLTVSGTALVSLTANDYIDVMLASSAVDTMTVSEAGITLFMLHQV